MSEFIHLDELRRLRRQWFDYGRKYEMEIEKEENEEFRRKAVLILTEYRNKIHVWCRNRNVCDLATLCRELQCKYKNKKKDTINGPAKCRQFQLTNKGLEWETCQQIAPFASVDIYYYVEI